MSFDICDCCGYEYDCDNTSSYCEEWLAKGAPWFSERKCLSE